MGLDSKSRRWLEPAEIEVRSFGYVIASFLCLLLCVGFSRAYFSGRQQDSGIRLDGRINPNEADVQSFMRLPGIGPRLAGAIVACRESFADGNRPVFGKAEDFQKVNGIGVKRAKKIEQWMRFEQKEGGTKGKIR